MGWDERLTRLAPLMAEVERVSASDVDTGWTLAVDGLRRLLPADQSFALIASRTEDADTFHGWTPIKLCYAPDDPQRRAVGERFRRIQASDDVTIHRVAAQYGRHRAYLRRDLGTSEELEAAPSTQLLRTLRIRDRVICAHSLDDRLEVFFVFDREGNSDPFDEVDRRFLEESMPAFARVCRWLALSHGAYPHQRLLSPREREALAHLLGPEPKKRIAAEMKLRAGSFNQLALRVYEKLGVAGRAALMALWLARPDDERS